MTCRFSGEIESIDRILIRIIIGIRRTLRDWINREKSAYLGHVASCSHLDDARREFRSPLFAAEPAEAAGRSRYRVAELVEAERSF